MEVNDGRVNMRSTVGTLWKQNILYLVGSLKYWVPTFKLLGRRVINYKKASTTLFVRELSGSRDIPL